MWRRRLLSPPCHSATAPSLTKNEMLKPICMHENTNYTRHIRLMEAQELKTACACTTACRQMGHRGSAAATTLLAQRLRAGGHDRGMLEVKHARHTYTGLSTRHQHCADPTQPGQHL